MQGLAEPERIQYVLRYDLHLRTNGRQTLKCLTAFLNRRDTLALKQFMRRKFRFKSFLGDLCSRGLLRNAPRGHYCFSPGTRPGWNHETRRGAPAAVTRAARSSSQLDGRSMATVRFRQTGCCPTGAYVRCMRSLAGQP